MPVALYVAAFLAATAVSLAASYLLVTRLERIGARFGLSEGLLGWWPPSPRTHPRSPRR